MKKSLSLICAVALLSAIVPFAACSGKAQVNYTLGEDGAHYVVSGVSGNKRSLSSCEIMSYYPKEDGELLPVTEIGDGAFKGCTSLFTLTLPQSIEIIGANAFAYCPLGNFALPQGVTTIGRGAFANCSALEKIVIPQSVTSIQPLAFAFCLNLESVVIEGEITDLPYRAFYNSYDMIGGNVYTSTSLVSVTLPATLEKIHNSALEGNYIQDIYFAGSEEQWNALYFYKTEVKEDGTEVETKVDKSEALSENTKIHFNCTIGG